MARTALTLSILAAATPTLAAPNEATRSTCPETGTVVILYGPENQPAVMRIGSNATMLPPSTQPPGELCVSRMHGWRKRGGNLHAADPGEGGEGGDVLAR